MRPPAKLSECLSRSTAMAKNSEDIRVDKLKNVPSLAIFYWFLFWLSNVIVACLKCEAFVAVDEHFTVDLSPPPPSSPAPPPPHNVTSGNQKL